jgi:uncharacterized paraquat-inducible protein A
MFPIITTGKEIWIIGWGYKDIRLYDSVLMFYNSNDYFLAAIIFLFTIILPIIKFLDMANRLFPVTYLPKIVEHILQLADKWSMLDVFLVALLLLNFKMNSNIIVMQLKIGTTFIAMSIILRMLSGYFIDLFINTKK